ncbi:MAG: diaminopimelate epimerase [Frankia sp.]
MGLTGGGHEGLRFVKGHGTANDFVLLPDPDGDLELTPELVRALCDRRRGIGGDGLLRVVLASAAGEPGADRPSAGEPAAGGPGPARWFMDYRNADGSIAEMCGNGIRVFARYLVDAGYAQPGPLAIATRAGVKTVEVPATGDVTVDMGPPQIADGPGTPVTLGGRRWEAMAVSMGNPHAVCFLADGSEGSDGSRSPGELAALDLTRPPSFDPRMFPTGVNVEFVADSGRPIALRVHERGVGETASCGTGACAVAVAHAVRSGAKPADGNPVEVDVSLPGGALHITWTATTVLLRGPAVLVADGILRAGWAAS